MLRLGGNGCSGCAPIPSALNGWRLNAARKVRFIFFYFRHRLLPPGCWIQECSFSRSSECRICLSDLCLGQGSPGLGWAEAGSSVTGGDEQAHQTASGFLLLPDFLFFFLSVTLSGSTLRERDPELSPLLWVKELWKTNCVSQLRQLRLRKSVVLWKKEEPSLQMCGW